MNLKEIFKPVSNDLQLVKQHLKRQIATIHTAQQLNDNQKGHAANVMNHFFHASGKGLRPALVLLTAKLAEPAGISDASSRTVIQFATAIELFHSASLAHDDVLDKAKYRRHQESLNEKYGNKIAVVIGDVFILQAFSLLFNLETFDLEKKEKVFHIIHRALQNMCLGEFCAHRLLTEQDTAAVDEYVGVLEKKTATLMSACCECGAILTDQEPETYQRMANFGRNFGIAFQAADDLKDQDALVEDGVDLVPFVKTYAQKAKDDLTPSTTSRPKKVSWGYATFLCRPRILLAFFIRILKDKKYSYLQLHLWGRLLEPLPQDMRYVF